MNHSEITSFIWGVADLIRDTFRRGRSRKPRPRVGLAIAVAMATTAATVAPPLRNGHTVSDPPRNTRRMDVEQFGKLRSG